MSPSRLSLTALPLALASFALLTLPGACSSSSNPVAAPDGGHDAHASASSSHAGSTHSSSEAHDAAPDVATGCGTYSAGGPCAPNGLTCSLPGCTTALCSDGMWVSTGLCTEGPPDAGHDAGVDAARDSGPPPLDGSVPVASCADCAAGDMCIINTVQGGACMQAHDGGACDNDASGACCNTYISYACHNLPAACTRGVTCACAAQYCGHETPGCETPNYDAASNGSFLVCNQDNP